MLNVTLKWCIDDFVQHEISPLFEREIQNSNGDKVGFHGTNILYATV